MVARPVAMRPASMSIRSGQRCASSVRVDTLTTGAMASPLTGTATLNDGQIGDLRAGLWYINVHTAKYPGGEIRGQAQVVSTN